MDDIVYEEGLFFRHAILSWASFAFKVYMNYMARTHFQIKDESLLAGLLPRVPNKDIGFSQDKDASDKLVALKLLGERVPFISPDVDFCSGSYAMVLLQHDSHYFRVAQAVYRFMKKAEKPWQCRLCLHLFVVAMQSAGIIWVPPADLREGPSVAATLWLNKTCGESTFDLRERWLDPRFLVDLPRDLDIFPLTKEENLIATRPSSRPTYIPLTRRTKESSASLSSNKDCKDQQTS